MSGSARTKESLMPLDSTTAVAVLWLALLAGCATPGHDFAGNGRDKLVPLEASCPEQSSTVSFQDSAVVEASGIARSQREPCVFWVHNDSGSGPELFATDGAGAALAMLTLNASATDWEDIATFRLEDVPYILVADTGNNARDREEVSFLIIEEPVLDPGSSRNLAIDEVVTVTVRYPDLPFDCESVAVDPATDSILLVSKGIPGAQSPAYPWGPSQALYTAPLSAAFQTRDVTVEFATLIPGIRPGPGDPASDYNYGVGGGQTTGMDIRPDGAAVAILTYREILEWSRSPTSTWSEALQGLPRAVQVPEPGKDQMEGLAYSEEGAMFLVVDEIGDGASEMTVVP